jgi:hypothetical protein
MCTIQQSAESASDHRRIALVSTHTCSPSSGNGPLASRASSTAYCFFSNITSSSEEARRGLAADLLKVSGRNLSITKSVSGRHLLCADSARKLVVVVNHRRSFVSARRVSRLERRLCRAHRAYVVAFRRRAPVQNGQYSSKAQHTRCSCHHALSLALICVCCSLTNRGRARPAHSLVTLSSMALAMPKLPVHK